MQRPNGDHRVKDQVKDLVVAAAAVAAKEVVAKGV